MPRAARVSLAVVALIAAVPAALAGFSATTAATGTLGTAADWVAPTVSATTIAKQTGYLAGAIKQGGTYYVYANVTDNGNPPAGVSTVRADVSTITAGQTSVTLTGGTYTVNGTTYGYRSGLLSAANPLAAGSKGYSVTSTDALGHAATQSFSTTVDNTGPSAADIQTANRTGGTAGVAESGDTITFTFSEQVDPESILAGWNGTSTSVVVHLVDGGCVLNVLVKVCADDSVQVYNGAGALTTLGPVSLKNPDYLGGGLIGSVADAVFGSTGTASTMVQSGAGIVVTLGTRSGSAPDPGGVTTTEWTSATTPYDAAGNTAAGNVRTEQGGSDREF